MQGTGAMHLICFPVLLNYPTLEINSKKMAEFRLWEIIISGDLPLFAKSRSIALTSFQLYKRVVRHGWPMDMTDSKRKKYLMFFGALDEEDRTNDPDNKCRGKGHAGELGAGDDAVFRNNNVIQGYPIKPVAIRFVDKPEFG